MVAGSVVGVKVGGYRGVAMLERVGYIPSVMGDRQTVGEGTGGMHGAQTAPATAGAQAIRTWQPGRQAGPSGEVKQKAAAGDRRRRRTGGGCMRRFGREAVGLHMAMSAGSDVLVQLDRHQKMSHSDDGLAGTLVAAAAFHPNLPPCLKTTQQICNLNTCGTCPRPSNLPFPVRALLICSETASPALHCLHVATRNTAPAPSPCRNQSRPQHSTRMPVVPSDKLVSLQQAADGIRNICILAHVVGRLADARERDMC